jgi:SAM-dependent methyltransferase|tara:strand:- start:754 stop:1443 length:690 start_codon:yes stop_codon:yes gene_type:complete
MSSRDEIDASAPHEQERSDRQLAWLRTECSGQCVLDLGCGNGRVAGEVSSVASRYVALDQDPAALARCNEVCERIELVEADMQQPPLEEGQFDHILCLGNTFCLLWDVDMAVAAMQRWRTLLNGEGTLVLDDIPQNLWPEVADGFWLNGVADEAGMQLVWARDDAVMVIREASDIDVDDPTFREGEQPMRLWTAGALRLAARLAGFEPPKHCPDAGVLILRPATPARPA